MRMFRTGRIGRNVVAGVCIIDTHLDFNCLSRSDSRHDKFRRLLQQVQVSCTGPEIEGVQSGSLQEIYARLESDQHQHE